MSAWPEDILTRSQEEAVLEAEWRLTVHEAAESLDYVASLMERLKNDRSVPDE